MDESDEALEILQNLEATVVAVWRANPEMTDHAVARAYEAAFRICKAELQGHARKDPDLKGIDAVLFQAIDDVCNFRLGRNSSFGPLDPDVKPITLEFLLERLRELMKSVERHTRVQGRQGYLGFIKQFIA
jgi:hypothetical protein